MNKKLNDNQTKNIEDIADDARAYYVYMYSNINKEKSTDDIVEKWKDNNWIYGESARCIEKWLFSRWFLFFISSAGKQKIKYLRDSKGIVHYSFVIPYCAKFSFMKKEDYQIGPCWTREEQRGKGIYVDMLTQITKEITQIRPQANIYMLVRKQNSSSIKGIEKADFKKVGVCKKTRFFKIYKKCKMIEQ